MITKGTKPLKHENQRSELPELRLGPDLVGRPQLHAKDLRMLLRWRRECPTHNLKLMKLHRNKKRKQTSTRAHGEQQKKHFGSDLAKYSQDKSDKLQQINEKPSIEQARPTQKEGGAPLICLP